jgi:Tfp pilus assembly protein PilZ
MSAGKAALPQLHLRYQDLESLREDYEQNLRLGRAFIVGQTDLSERDACELVLVHPGTGDTLNLPAEVVWIKPEEPGRGTGLVLPELGSDETDRLETFVRKEKKAAVPNVHERMRGISAAEQNRFAREGELAERVALERVYGKAVWEPLVDNPRVTVPEVARIARKGNIPKPLLEKIVANAAWLASSELRRALLSNARLGGAALDKVLRALPRAELALAALQPSYPLPVRQAAKKLRSR